MTPPLDSTKSQSRRFVEIALQLYAENGSLQCLTWTSKDDEPEKSMELDINANVSFKNIGPQGYSNANVVQPNIIFTNIIMETTTKATWPITCRPTMFNSCLFGPIIQTKAKRIKGLLTNKTIVIGGFSTYTLWRPL